VGPIVLPVTARPRRDIRVVLGPQDRFFPPAGIAAFLAGPYALTSSYDRMGVRLKGPALEVLGRLDMPSEAVVRGAVQVAGDGQPTVLLADHQTTGGYPKIATIASIDLDAFVQLRPHALVRFRAVSAEHAVALLARAIGWAAATEAPRRAAPHAGADFPARLPYRVADSRRRMPMFLANQHADYRRPSIPSTPRPWGRTAPRRWSGISATATTMRRRPCTRSRRWPARSASARSTSRTRAPAWGSGASRRSAGPMRSCVSCWRRPAAAWARPVDVAELHAPEVRAVAAGMTFACATDGNHGRSVAQGAALVGASSAIFVHSGVSEGRIAAIARFGRR
jgi:hypothetical protein